jgi:hypothetical protein
VRLPRANQNPVFPINLFNPGSDKSRFRQKKSTPSAQSKPINGRQSFNPVNQGSDKRNQRHQRNQNSSTVGNLLIL